MITTSFETVEKALRQWQYDIKDPRMDGFFGWGQKQKLYQTKKLLDSILSDSDLPTYVGEKEWLAEENIDI